MTNQKSIGNQLKINDKSEIKVVSKEDEAPNENQAESKEIQMMNGNSNPMKVESTRKMCERVRDSKSLASVRAMAVARVWKCVN